MKASWSKLLWHWLWPEICAHYREDLPRGAGEPLCRTCRPKLVPSEPPFCLRCAAPVKAYRTHCRSCASRLHACGLIRSAFLYQGPAVSVVHAFKYRGRRPAGEAAGAWMAQAWGRFPELGKPDALVPVPLHPRRLRRRGYNQALLLAERLSAATGIPLREMLRRRQDTKPQWALGRRQRLKNLEGAFEAEPARGARLLLVDDVCTSSASLEACARALQEAEAAWVRAFVFARQARFSP